MPKNTTIEENRIPAKEATLEAVTVVLADNLSSIHRTIITEHLATTAETEAVRLFQIINNPFLKE